MRDEIPQRADGFTPAWLTESLRASGILDAARVTRVANERIGEGDGFMGEIFRLRLDYDLPEPRAPKSLIAKVPTHIVRNMAEGELLGLYDRESLFYETFARDFPIRIPRHYFSNRDPKPGTPESEDRLLEWVERRPAWVVKLLQSTARGMIRLRPRRHVLLLEDLPDARAGDQVEGCDDRELPALVANLAKLQARFWGGAELEPLHWIPRLDKAPRSIHLFYRKALPEFLRLHGEALPENIRELTRWIDANGVALQHVFMQTPLTLNHGDYRLDNLFLDSGGDQGEIVVFDWQAACRAPGVYDLAYFLTGTLPPDPDHTRENELVAHYRSQIARAGISYSEEDCARDYDRAKLMILHRMVGATTSVEFTTDRGHALISGWLKRLLARFEGLPAPRFIDRC